MVNMKTLLAIVSLMLLTVLVSPNPIKTFTRTFDIQRNNPNVRVFSTYPTPKPQLVEEKPTKENELEKAAFTDEDLSVTKTEGRDEDLSHSVNVVENVESGPDEIQNPLPEKKVPTTNEESSGLQDSTNLEIESDANIVDESEVNNEEIISPEGGNDLPTVEKEMQNDKMAVDEGNKDEMTEAMEEAKQNVDADIMSETTTQQEEIEEEMPSVQVTDEITTQTTTEAEAETTTVEMVKKEDEGAQSEPIGKSLEHVAEPMIIAEEGSTPMEQSAPEQEAPARVQDEFYPQTFGFGVAPIRPPVVDEETMVVREEMPLMRKEIEGEAEVSMGATIPQNEGAIIVGVERIKPIIVVESNMENNEELIPIAGVDTMIAVAEAEAEDPNLIAEEEDNIESNVEVSAGPIIEAEIAVIENDSLDPIAEIPMVEVMAEPNIEAEIAVIENDLLDPIVEIPMVEVMAEPNIEAEITVIENEPLHPTAEVPMIEVVADPNMEAEITVIENEPLDPIAQIPMVEVMAEPDIEAEITVIENEPILPIFEVPMVPDPIPGEVNMEMNNDAQIVEEMMAEEATEDGTEQLQAVESETLNDEPIIEVENVNVLVPSMNIEEENMQNEKSLLDEEINAIVVEEVPIEKQLFAADPIVEDRNDANLLEGVSADVNMDEKAEEMLMDNEQFAVNMAKDLEEGEEGLVQDSQNERMDENEADILDIVILPTNVAHIEEMEQTLNNEMTENENFPQMTDEEAAAVTPNQEPELQPEPEIRQESEMEPTQQEMDESQLETEPEQPEQEPEPVQSDMESTQSMPELAQADSEIESLQQETQPQMLSEPVPEELSHQTEMETIDEENLALESDNMNEEPIAVETPVEMNAELSADGIGEPIVEMATLEQENQDSPVITAEIPEHEPILSNDL